MQRAPEAAHHLDLGRRRQLVVHPAQGALAGRQRGVDLDETRDEPLRRELDVAEESSKKTTVISALLQVD